MKLEKETISHLAAEYVLGTLRGPARRRFERMMSENPEVASAVQSWNERWTILYEDMPDQQPSPKTWRTVERRLGWSNAPSGLTRLWNNLHLWRGISAVALTASLVTVLLWPSAVAPPTDQAAPSALVLVLADDQQRVGWVMAAAENRLESRPLGDLQLSSDRAYELWLVPQGQSPLSLGLINPDASSAFQLDHQLARQLRPGATLAVSLEPTGGSPTGQPTGPIVYTGQIIEL